MHNQILTRFGNMKVSILCGTSFPRTGQAILVSNALWPNPLCRNTSTRNASQVALWAKRLFSVYRDALEKG